MKFCVHIYVHVLYGHAVLHCRDGHLSVVQYLVKEANCDPYVEDDAGWTPLHRACSAYIFFECIHIFKPGGCYIMCVYLYQ